MDRCVRVCDRERASICTVSAWLVVWRCTVDDRMYANLICNWSSCHCTRTSPMRKTENVEWTKKRATQTIWKSDTAYNSIMNIYLDHFKPQWSRDAVAICTQPALALAHTHTCTHNHGGGEIVCSRHNATRNSIRYFEYTYIFTSSKKCNRHSWKILVIAHSVLFVCFFFCYSLVVAATSIGSLTFKLVLLLCLCDEMTLKWCFNIDCLPQNAYYARDEKQRKIIKEIEWERENEKKCNQKSYSKNAFNLLIHALKMDRFIRHCTGYMRINNTPTQLCWFSQSIFILGSRMSQRYITSFDALRHVQFRQMINTNKRTQIKKHKFE